jgi:hypothetical protein
MRKMLAALVATSILTCAPAVTLADDIAAWTITLHPADFVIGAPLAKLRTGRAWAPGFDEDSGTFEIALRKKAVAIPAPRCRTEFLILAIPFYYPENPKQASVSERRAIYDRLCFVSGRRRWQPDGAGRSAVRPRTYGSERHRACRLQPVLRVSTVGESLGTVNPPRDRTGKIPVLRNTCWGR